MINDLKYLGALIFVAAASIGLLALIIVLYIVAAGALIDGLKWFATWGQF